MKAFACIQTLSIYGKKGFIAQAPTVKDEVCN